MPTHAGHTAFQGLGSRAAAIRDAALLAGVSVDQLLRTRADGRMSRPLLIGTGLVLGGAVVALAHLAGTDLRAGAGLATGQPGLLQAVSDQNPPPP